MINIIRICFSFFKSYGVVLLVLLLFVAIISTYFQGYRDGKKQAEVDYTKIQVQQAADTLNQFIEGAKQLTQAANDASKALSGQIVERKLYDEQSTKALQDALKSTVDSRVNCVFDGNILQHIDTARDNAVKATTGGITGTTGSALRITDKAP